MAAARPRILPEDAERLRAMQATAATIRGGTPADAPARRVAEQFAEELAVLVNQGVSIKHLAAVLGCARGAIQGRLGRYGYRQLPPSQTHTAVKGRNRTTT
jgi:predicted TIM-barrel enzyme